MYFILNNDIKVVEPDDRIKQWCEENLVIPNPEYAKKLRMGLWTGNTPKKLYLYAKDGDNLILPYGVLNDLPSYMFLPPCGMITGFRKSRNVEYGDPVPLYDYQRRAVDAMQEAMFGILQSPAGSGKTQMGIALIKRYRKKALWLTHTADLLRQSKTRAEMYIDPSLIGTITAGKVDIGKGVTFATVQTLSKLDMSQYRYNWDVVIVDEAHRVCGSPSSAGMFYKILNNLSARHKFGLSATVHRSDGMIKATYAILGKIAYSVPEEDVAGRIMKVKIKTVNLYHTQLTRECLNTDGTINYTSLITALTRNEDRNQSIVKAIVKNDTKPSLILSDRLEHLETLMAMLPPELQEKSVMLSGKMVGARQRRLRAIAIDKMTTGEKQFLFATYALAKEGLDIPRLERLYMATPQKDFAVVTQSVGRIARVFTGKCDPICYDFVDLKIPLLAKSYKTRCRTYKKIGCEMI